jgi:hypothetical protein
MANMARFTAPIPSWAGRIRRLALDRRPAFARRIRRNDQPGKLRGAMKEILPVAEIMRHLVAEPEATLSRAVDFR